MKNSRKKSNRRAKKLISNKTFVYIRVGCFVYSIIMILISGYNFLVGFEHDLELKISVIELVISAIFFVLLIISFVDKIRAEGCPLVLSDDED